MTYFVRILIDVEMDHWTMFFFCLREMACMRVSPMRSHLLMLVIHPLLTAQRATLAAAPGRPRQRVQQVWLSFSPHLSAHFLSLSSHPLVALHFLYSSGHLSYRHFSSSGDWAAMSATKRRVTKITFIAK